MSKINRSMKMALLGAVLMVFGITAVQAQPAEGRRRGNWGDPAEMFKSMDTDGSGTIEASEFRGPEQFFTRMDADGDGKVTATEFTEARDRMRQPRGERSDDAGPAERSPNIDRIKEQLGVSDEEWTVLKPRIEKIITMDRFRRDMPEVRALREVVEKKDATAEDIKAKLAAYRVAREKARDEQKKARAELKELLTLKQEAVLVLHSVLE